MGPGRSGWLYSVKNDLEGEESGEAALSMQDTASWTDGLHSEGPGGREMGPRGRESALHTTVGAHVNLPLTLKGPQREARRTTTSIPLEQDHSGVQNIFTWERRLLG